MIIGDIMNHPIGRILVSVILGFGLASLFRKVCSGKSCIIVKGPSPEEVKKYYYKIEEDCYKYTPIASKCEGDGK